VLNAFRHHRDDHNIVLAFIRARDYWCSTPFGITEMITRSNGLDLVLVDQCSTPFGITEMITSV